MWIGPRSIYRCIALRLQFHPQERIGLFVDGPNFHATTVALGFDADFRRFFDLLRKRGHLVRASYYTTQYDVDMKRTPCALVEWLAYNGFTTFVAPLRDRGTTGRDAARMAVELAVDVLASAANLDHVVLVSGNGDYRCLVASLQDSGKRVSVISSLVTRPPMVSDGLRRQADHFIELADLRADIALSSTTAGGRGRDD